MKRYNFYPINHQSGNRIEAEDGEYVAAEDALRLQSELTKARELLDDAQDRYQHGTLGWYDIQDFLSRHPTTPIAHNVDESCGQDAEVACPKCNNTGEADSGGVQPWGEGISIPCDCQDAEAAKGVRTSLSDAAKVLIDQEIRANGMPS